MKGGALAEAQAQVKQAVVLPCQPQPVPQPQPLGAGVTALAVASRFKARLQNVMRREWLRVDHDVREGSGMPRAWLRGPSPVIARSTFLARWSGLVALAANGLPSLVVSLAGLS